MSRHMSFPIAVIAAWAVKVFRKQEVKRPVDERRKTVKSIGRGSVLLVWGMVFVCVLPFSAGAENLQKTATPIEIAVKPPVAMPGAQVSLSGNSVQIGKHKTVAIVVQPPSGAAANLTAEVDGKGKFSASYKVGGPGTYHVTATSADAKNQAKSSVTVVAPVTYTHEAAKSVQALFERLKEASASLRTEVAAMPPSPPKEELLKKLEALEKGFQESPAQSAKFRDGMASLDKLVQDHPETLPELQPAYDAIGEMSEKAKEMEAKLKERVKQQRPERAICDDLDVVNEGLSFFSLAMSVTISPVKTVLNVLVSQTLPDRVLSRVSALKSPMDKFAAATAIKQAYNGAQGWGSFVQGQVGFIGSAVQYMAQKYFGVYCEKFEGPVRAVFYLEYSEGKRKWLAYDVKLDGMLFLRYQKGSGGPEGIRVNGEFEGSATDFTIWEKLDVVEPLARRYAIFHVGIPPMLPSGHVGELGKMGRFLLTPYHFYIPVSGLLKGNKLALKFGEARQDFEGKAKAKIVYVLLEPALPIPYVANVEIPYKGAHYILSRGTRKEPVFTVEVDKAKKISRIKQTFTRKEENPGSWMARFKVEIDACNPSCP